MFAAAVYFIYIYFLVSSAVSDALFAGPSLSLSCLYSPVSSLALPLSSLLLLKLLLLPRLLLLLRLLLLHPLLSCCC